MSGFPAGEVPQTSFTVRSFNFLCPDPEDSRSKESARGRALPSPGSCTESAAIPLCGNTSGKGGS